MSNELEKSKVPPAVSDAPFTKQEFDTLSSLSLVQLATGFEQSCSDSTVNGYLRTLAYVTLMMRKSTVLCVHYAGLLAGAVK